MAEEISILIIEDEPMWAQSLSITLQDFGYTITGQVNSFEAAALALNQKNYDLVLLDIHLNGRDSGIELGTLIHTIYKKPFIYITASYDAETAKAAVASGPSAYLTKPVHPSSLFVSIQTALRNFQGNITAQPANDNPTEDSFFVKQGDKYKKLYWKDIVSLSSEKNYTGVFSAADQSQFFIRSTLPKTLGFLVPPDLRKNFVQVNRAEVVQISFIQELTRESVKTPFRNYQVTEGFMKDLKDKLRILS